MHLFKTLTLFACFFLYSSILHAAQAAIQTTIIEAEGYACMGDDKSKKQTEQFALIDAKRKASEAALTYVKSETKVENLEIQKDLLAAFSNAHVKVIQELDESWYKDTSAGDCYKIKIRAEVKPEMKMIFFSDPPQSASNNNMLDTAWHRYKGRKFAVWGRVKNASRISIPSDGWRLIGPTVDHKDEYEWGWEVTLSIAPFSAQGGFLELKKIEYTLLDEDGFVLVSDKLDLSGFDDSIEPGFDGATVSLLQEIGTTKTYRQISKINIPKALRARASKYLISVN